MRRNFVEFEVVLTEIVSGLNCASLRIENEALEVRDQKSKHVLVVEMKELCFEVGTSGMRDFTLTYLHHFGTLEPLNIL